MSKSIKSGDQVVVISGNSKGKTGKVRNIVDERVFVENVNMCKRHMKPSQRMQKGGIVEKEASIHISNVMLMTKDGQRSRVGMRKQANGKYARVLKKSGEVCQ